MCIYMERESMCVCVVSPKTDGLVEELLSSPSLPLSSLLLLVVILICHPNSTVLFTSTNPAGRCHYTPAPRDRGLFLSGSLDKIFQCFYPQDYSQPVLIHA